jgi:hypothetical protein
MVCHLARLDAFFSSPGMMQNGTLLSDGAYGVNQCGVLPGDAYLYNFTTDTPGTSDSITLRLFERKYLL